MKNALQTIATVFLLLTVISVNAQEEQKESEAKVDKEVKELSGISIIGNKEAPKSLYIVPWKSSEVGVESGLNSSLLDPRLQPLDKEVFSRELEFYQLSLTDE
ncbi:hypothetical protein ACONUD_00465 [Microbulbifer harenosus]|uniref:Uncharacterized protein n=1 Tax=Microbulbifer harenosus TaxID=2576840 RepID=A0ABY2UMU9_9GAMM|nr:MULTISPECIES: hypothetical protein [Microbulbifer]QIL89975.1 hypothetical protein GNX18_09575 [Microbulbifer sp. SH-1]TLM79889.1 hypothetical protein FDY93_00465 [Microbulbifer harenosus]